MKVYLSGGIYANDKEATESWRNEATKELQSVGIEIITPCRRRAIYDPSIFTTAEIVTRDKQDINNADLILINGNFEDDHLGIGTWCEMEYAYSLSKPIVIVSRDLRVLRHPWTQHYAVKFFSTIKDACDYIRIFWS